MKAQSICAAGLKFYRAGMWARWAPIVCALAFAASCSGHDRGAAERTATSTAAISSPPLTLDLAFPQGYGLSRVALAAGVDVSLGTFDTVLATNGSPGTVTSAGAGAINVLTGASTGDIVSTGNVILYPLGVHAGNITASGSVLVGPGDTATSVTQHATLVPLSHRIITVSQPADMTNIFFALPGTTSTLSPGGYDSITISPGAQVTLTAGTYVVNSFNLLGLGKLNLDTSNGSVNLYVKNTVLWNGPMTGDGTRFVFGYLGCLPLTLPPTFTGTALAPNALLTLGPLPGTYHGTFYAQHLFIAGFVTVQQIQSPLLIDELRVAKTPLCVGESTEVTVPQTDPALAASTWVQGVAGAHQYVQFGNAPGTRLVFATVKTPDGRMDFTSVPVTVQSCAVDPAHPPITFHFWGDRKKPNQVEFMVRGFDPKGHEQPLAGPATYAWSFGDGQGITTDSPLTVHDYTASMHPLEEHTFFTVSVTVTAGAATSSLTKVVPVWSLYAKNRSKGIVQPPAVVAAAGTDVALVVQNLESTPISLNSGWIELVPCDPAVDPTALPTQSLAVSIPAGASQTVHLSGPVVRSGDTCSMGVHVMGTATAGRVYADAYQRLQENPILKKLVTDPATIALLNAASTMTADPNHFSETELRNLVAKGTLARMPPGLPPGSSYSDVGAECEPGDRDPVNGLACLPTADWVTNPPEFVNARKGDVFMDRGCGTIGQLLDSIHQHFSHDLLFVKNHVEIRHSTANEDRIGGAVEASELKLDETKLQYGFPGTEGSKTHSIGEMTTFYCVQDPEGNGGSQGERHCDPHGNYCECPAGSWRMGGESSPDPVACDSDFTAVPPVLVRPPPSRPDLYQTIGPVVDQAMIANNHYRFFMYSHADQVQTASTSDPSDAWANGTLSTVCSSFVQHSALLAGVSMNPASSSAAHVLDGLRPYNVDERLAAAHTLYATSSNKVHDACFLTPAGGAFAGGAIGLLGGPIGVAIGAAAGLTAGETCDLLADNIANQNTNCFGNDQCDNASPVWKNPGAGVAVSPEDIISWELPATAGRGGTWGYNEAAIYAEVSFRHKYAWVKPAGTGSLTVTVKDPNGKLVPGATVLVNDQLYGTTDAQGVMRVDALPAGPYYVAAELNPCTSVLPNLPPPPTPPDASTIPTLPKCESVNDMAVKACQKTAINGVSCPKNWLDVSIAYPAGTVACVVDPSGATVTPPGEDTPVPQWLCSCVQRAPSCPILNPLQSGATPTTVVANLEDDVTIRLCNGGLQDQGGHKVPQSCPQSCTNDSNCDSSQMCRQNLCAPLPRKVRIASTSLDIQTYDNDSGLSPSRNEFHAAFTVDCDPAVNSGMVHYSVCEDTDEQVTFVLDATCIQGGDGGFTVNMTAHLDEGCGTGETDHPNDHVSFTVGVAPANHAPGSPNPVADYGSPTNQATSFFSAPDENSAHFSLELTNIPK